MMVRRAKDRYLLMSAPYRRGGGICEPAAYNGGRGEWCVQWSQVWRFLELRDIDAASRREVHGDIGIWHDVRLRLRG